MPFAIECSAESERDFELIFDHLFESYIGFGETTGEALECAARRIMGIRAAAERLATLPLRGTPRDDVLPRVRYLAVDRAIYWFDVDEAASRARILAVFFGGQDHVRHEWLSGSNFFGTQILPQDPDARGGRIGWEWAYRRTYGKV